MSDHIFISLSPIGGVLTDLYTVPVGKKLTARVVCTNRGVATFLRVKVSPNLAENFNEHSILHDYPLGANQPITTAPLMLSAGATIRVLSVHGLVNFHVTGLLQDAS